MFLLREGENMAERPAFMSPRYVTCRCQYCDKGIEFDASDFGEGETRTVECPHCQMETAIFVPAIPIPDVESKIEAPPIQPVWFGSELSQLEIKLSSGTLFEIKELKLFRASALQELERMKTEAAQQMGGVSTGLWSFGSLSWVLMASGAIGTVESVLSNRAEKKGVMILQAAVNLEKQIRETAQFIHVGQINEIEHPTPALWYVPVQPCYPTGFMHSGDDFVIVKDVEGTVHSIRWSAVESYNYQSNK